MKRLIRSSSEPQKKQCLLTPKEVVDLLMQIDELKGCSILLDEKNDGRVCFYVGENEYECIADKPSPTVR